MKTRLFFSISISLLCICSWSGCEKDVLEEIDWSGLCAYRDSLSVPTGYTMEFIDTLPKPVNVKHFHFVDDQLGYALASGKYGYVDVLKTVDGGFHWTDLKVDFDNFPRSLAFISPDTGVLTLYDVTGCPNQCQNICSILRTTNGGFQWTKHHIPNFKGNIRHLSNDQNGHFFGVLYFENNETLVWSNDKGITWDTFPNFNATFEDVGDLQVFQDNIYVITTSNIFVIDLLGQLIKTISIPPYFNNDLKIIDEDQFILSTNDSVIVTQDGFQSTRTILKERATIIGYTGVDHVIAIVNKSYCPSDVVQTNDLIAYTHDGGQTWTEGHLKTNLMFEIRSSIRVNDDHYLALLNRSIYELKRI